MKSRNPCMWGCGAWSLEEYKQKVCGWFPDSAERDAECRVCRIWASLNAHKRCDMCVKRIYIFAVGLLATLIVETTFIKDFKFVPLIFVTIGFGSQIPLRRAIFYGLGAQTQGYEPSGYKGKFPEFRSLGLLEERIVIRRRSHGHRIRTDNWHTLPSPK